MNGKEHRKAMIGLGISTAMAAVLLTGCAGTPGPRANVAAADAARAMESGRTSEAIQHAEAAVAADPRNAGYRMVLGNAYLNEGRFASASTSFQDAMTLGDNSPRAALSLALALTGEARFDEAAALLRDWEGEIAAPDLGLAYALAGEPERGIHILSNAIRQGQNTVKVRQNLAYSYAVAGRWREARLMVAQDVPADQVGDRMEQWAQLAHAEAYQHRVATLLDVPTGVRDGGQPQHLALVDRPDMEQLASEASVEASADVAALAVADTGGELPASTEPEFGFDTYQTRSDSPPVNFAESFVSDKPSGASLAGVATDTMRFVSTPVVQATPPRRGSAPEQRSAAPRPVARVETPASTASAASARNASAPERAVAVSAVDDPTHLVQLGSFASEQGARRAWGIYVSRHPELANHQMVITEAVVRGKRYWRVSAGGFDSASSRSMCANVNNSSSGEGCITWAASTPLPGAVDDGVRLASR
ncbi:SPOR domain-containing protein [Aurantiacibacter hainanensis]|uniref:SPOR domain-containing protein n=1 Tax=Aurantiacibacter hainanensis TaxID=3076114 RepID=UPI0030C6A745